MKRKLDEASLSYRRVELFSMDPKIAEKIERDFEAANEEEKEKHKYEYDIEWYEIEIGGEG